MDRMDELNDRLMNRHQFNREGTIKFDIRSTPTRNICRFPALYKKDNSKTQFRNVSQDFNKTIDIESILRNQTYALQHGASQSVYVPSSTSDLYQTILPISTNNLPQPHLGLFETMQYKTTENQFIQHQSLYNQQPFNICSRNLGNLEED